MDQEKLFVETLRLNEVAASAGYFEAAYHLLAAALHLAETAGNGERLHTVINVAVSQGEAVDADIHNPLASVNATARGNTPLYESLVGTARSALARLEAQRLQAKQRAKDA